MSADIRFAEAPAIPPAPGPTRPTIAAVRVLSATIAVSGQTAIGPDGSLVASGRVGAEIDLAMARYCAWQCAANVLSAVKTHLGTLDRVAAVAKIRVYVASTPDFIEQHLVADAATSYIQHVLGDEAGLHARAAIGVACLPTGSPVEVEADFELAY
jgi:enamine deaminase RidA (YjgF/YER057c/UK114 family)